TFPELTDVVLGRSRRDFGSVLLVARGMPLRDGVKDDLGRERSHLSKVRITNHLAFNSLPLRLQVVFCLLQLCDQPVERLVRRTGEVTYCSFFDLAASKRPRLIDQPPLSGPGGMLV